MSARERISRIIEKWFLAEPLLFAAWNTHALVVDPRIRNIRVEHGRIEYNPGFVGGLTARRLEVVLQFEALRILLKHPYARRKEDPRLAYEASNITLQEYLHSELPVPTARERFGSAEYDRQYFELYYAQLEADAEKSAARLLVAPADTGTAAGAGGDAGKAGAAGARAPSGTATSAGEGDGSGHGGEQTVQAMGENTREHIGTGTDPIAAYADPARSGEENSAGWEPDELLTDSIDLVIREARANNRWGTVGGALREQILATLRPVLDYRAVLRQFRTSILSQRRSLTRMKPNRRYGFDYLGSRREFTTRLLVAVDVSGSMGTEDLRRGFSLVNRFFKYGVSQVDVIQFDTRITGKPMTLKQARHSITAVGRGGTDFAPVMAYLDQHREYDGVIIFTDGYAPVPAAPRNRRTRILWLFVHESLYRASYPGLKHLGKGAFLREDHRDA